MSKLQQIRNNCSQISNEEPGHKTKTETRNAFYNLNKQKYQTIAQWKHSKIMTVSIIEDKEEKNDRSIGANLF